MASRSVLSESGKTVSTVSKNDNESVIDTSRMSEGERAALEVTEAAREAASMERTFAGGLFLGRHDLSQITPFPEQTIEDRDQGDAFLCRLEEFLRSNTNPDEIDESGEIPDEVIAGLAKLGAFGIKIPTRYGGLGLSQTNYCRAAMLLGSWCGNMTALLSAHQSIGVPQPLLLFGTEEQRQRYLPRVAKGEISAFALTEPGVGSDPARMETFAEPDRGRFGIHSERPQDVVYERHARRRDCRHGEDPAKGDSRAKQESNHGLHRGNLLAGHRDCPALPVHGIACALQCRYRFSRRSRAPQKRSPCRRKRPESGLEHVEHGTSYLARRLCGTRQTVPGDHDALGEIARPMGRPIGEHAAIASKIADMAAETFAMESMTMLTASLVDRAKSDFRLESAICKMLATEWAWKIANDTMQIRGGRGYETAASLGKRGESPDPVERIMRDSRINTIFEGSSEIMRLFIAREALDPHLKISAPILDRRLPASVRGAAGLRAARFYSVWYPSTLLPRPLEKDFDRRLARHLRWCESCARRLARRMFHQMVVNGSGLEKRQLLLGRFVDIGAEIFAMSATLSRAQAMVDRSDPDASRGVDLADYFCRSARFRIAEWFRSVTLNVDGSGYRLAANLLADLPETLSEGILRQAVDG